MTPLNPGIACELHWLVTATRVGYSMYPYTILNNGLRTMIKSGLESHDGLRQIINNLR